MKPLLSTSISAKSAATCPVKRKFRSLRALSEATPVDPMMEDIRNSWHCDPIALRVHMFLLRRGEPKSHITLDLF